MPAPGRSLTWGRSLALLLLLACVVLVVWAQVHHWSGLVDAAAELGGLATLLAVVWPPLWGERRSGAAEQDTMWLADLADNLAHAMGEQWGQEAEIRRLNYPYPLPIAWSAELSLTDDWAALRKLATTGAGWHARAAPGQWAANAVQLSGVGDLADTFQQVPTGRLVVLGEPGAGKTIALIRLVLSLLDRRSSGDPVPVLLPLTSWNPAGSDLNHWIAVQLTISYPELGAPAPAGPTGRTCIQALLDAGLVLPVLDGLDEIKEQLRPVAVDGIRSSLRDGHEVIVACRTKEYRTIVRPDRGTGITLQAAAVLLQPLDAQSISDYLRPPDGPTSSRWDPVLAVLDAPHPVAQALASPLMLSLARAIYEPRPGEHTGALRNPAELLDMGFADCADVEGYLFDAFLAAAYRPPVYRRERYGSWSAGQATRWLGFLAGHLKHTLHTTDLAWWSLSRSVSRLVFGLVVGVLTFIIFGVAGWVAGGGSGTYGVNYALAYGTSFGAATGLCAAVGSKKALSGVEFHVRGNLLRSAGLLLGGSMAGLVFLQALEIPSPLPASAAVGVGLAVYGWQSTPVLNRVIPSPQATLARDRARTLLPSVAVALGAGVFGGWDVGQPVPDTPNSPLEILIAVVASSLLGAALGALGYGRLGAVAYALCGIVLGLGNSAWGPPVSGWGPGLAFGAAFGLGIGWIAALPRAWGAYTVTRLVLTVHGHRLPLRLVAFLDDAHRRGVLRQNGAVYEFRHQQLQERLATGNHRPAAIGDPLRP